MTEPRVDCAARPECAETKRKSKKKNKKYVRRPGIKPGSRPWQGRILSLYYRRMLTLSVPRLELGISRVLGERHSQLDHTDGSKNYLEYLGFDPSTSTLLRSHASDCANTPWRRCSRKRCPSISTSPAQRGPAGRKLASIAQLAEHALSKRKVASSILAGGSLPHPSWCSW